MSKYARILAVTSCIFFAGVGLTSASAPPVPEIDPGTASSAIALLACGALMLVRRLGRK